MGCQIHSSNPQVLCRVPKRSSRDYLSPYSNVFQLRPKTLESCSLGIASYPDFKYNAQGGKALTTATTKFLGLPLPPFLRIDIVPQLFQGSINSESGQVDLEFKAKFLFSIGSIYKAPPLVVETVLTSEESKGTMRNGRGERLNTEGRCRLVGVATVEPINDFLLDSFLGLPTECLADLNALISFKATQ
ncbi:ATP-dependent Clp protease ATP-binding [Heracleum sosnowskyi]|uniref:ATP-dependent Clp protease ATP-binding n=1 Tax=Heracleum sosnowskyi TaxID=360622 RepID=A0AAD8JAM1_9APIA|nr:ATP-dependent Clp protease ATP-binding [Heracleum sosnowskyi]